MNVFQHAEELGDYLEKRRNSGHRGLGFVPTMGALHQGHLSLITSALDECTEVVVSIFVNPTQFNDPSDLKNYPRPIEKDMELLLSSGVQLLFLPEADEIYGEKYRSEHIDLLDLDKKLEGEHRPGHFQGVANVVRRLFDIIKPDRAYFGQKDYQQTLVIRRVVELFHPTIELRIMPIVREENGLAMSSRNMRLGQEARASAGFIYEALADFRQDVRHMALTDALQRAKNKIINVKDAKLEYLMVINEDTFTEARELKEGERYVALIALFFHGVRLIDNIYL